MRREAHLANFASYGWAALVGSLVLDAIVPSGVSAAVDPRAWLAVAVTGAVVLCVNFAVTNAIVAYVLDGRSVASLVHSELITATPAVALMIATGTVTVFLYLAIGIPALALFSATVFIPRMAARLGDAARAGGPPRDQGRRVVHPDTRRLAGPVRYRRTAGRVPSPE
jgi:hypothetical protein